jgi:hypothetical protein
MLSIRQLLSIRVCQIFLGTTYQNWGTMYEITTKYTKWP